MTNNNEEAVSLSLGVITIGIFFFIFGAYLVGVLIVFLGFILCTIALIQAIKEELELYKFAIKEWWNK